MLFTSIEFAILLVIVFFSYWQLTRKSTSAQNAVLLVSSYVFYGWWDWRFLILMFFSSGLDFLVGQKIHQSQSQSNRKAWLAVSIAVNIGLLGFFKYFNFFVDSFVAAFEQLGLHLNLTTFNIILPVGISFYTFQTLSYSIDIYRKVIRPTSNVISYFAFVSFFPQLVAGPIERAKSLLPQFEKGRSFDYDLVKDGLRQILWGLVKKVVIADTIAIGVDEIFAAYNSMTSSTLAVGLVLFSFQVYADFSSYSDIAIGLGKLFGIRLMKNFAYPFFSTRFDDVWKRWHISLFSWLRDYIYMPLRTKKRSQWLQFRNIMIVFLISGLWHGANWTFVAMGFIHGIFTYATIRSKAILPEKENHWKSGRVLPTFSDIKGMVLVFILFAFASVMFRAPDIGVAVTYLKNIATPSILSPPQFIPLVLLGISLLAIEWCNRTKEHPLKFDHWPLWGRWAVYYGLIFLFLNTHHNSQAYIYFQF